MPKLRQNLLTFTCLVAVPALAMTAPAVAQQDDPVAVPDAPVDSAAAAEDTVVVTGSRIRRGNAESPIPLQVFGADDIAEIGTTDLAEALVQLPGVAPGVTPQNSNNLIQTSGLSTISLRRLGDERTLTLINGKRAVSNSGNSDRVSLSTLPSGFVERTEITTGGASAVYGSDAIAGVVNFLLEDDFEGVELEARFSAPQASGGEEAEARFLAGQQFADDRGYVMFGFDYQDREITRADNSRPESILAVEFDDPTDTSSTSFTGELEACPQTNPDNNRHCFLPSFSQSTPGGVFENTDAWFVNGQWFNDRSLQPDDRTGTQDFFSDFDGWNFRPDRTLIGAREIFNVGLHSTYEFTSNIEGSVTALYSDIETQTINGYETLNHSDGFGRTEDDLEVGNIASDHPFIPPEVEETRSGSIDFDRRLIELGEQSRINNRETIRIMADLTGELDNGYSWEIYGTYGYFEQIQENPNEVNFFNAREALNIEAAPGGGFQCVDAIARANGCVPLNIFGEGTITPEAADYIRYNGYADQNRTQYTFGGYITGDVFELPSGVVKAAAGLEYRKEEQETNGDPDGQEPVDDLDGGLDGDPTTDDDFDVTSLATFPSVTADYAVVEGFGEVEFPLSEQILVNIAARVADYDSIGSIFSYNVGAVWSPVDDFRVRGQYSRSQRAPNLSELFSPPRPDSDSLVHPCEGLEPDGSGLPDRLAGNGGDNADMALVAANCLSLAGVQQYFIDNPGDEFDAPGSVQGPNAGNPNVQEETADTFTIGAIIEPRWIPNLSMIVDYYRIEIEDAIISISTQDQVDLCFSATDFLANSFCDVITINQTDGVVEEVINFQDNLEEVVVEGIDFNLEYEFELPNIGGEFDIDYRQTHYITDETSFTGIGGVALTDSNLGQINTPEDEARLRFGYSNDGFRASYTVTYTSGGVDDLENAPNPEDDRFFEVDDQFYHRVYVRQDFGPDDRFRVYAGINNIFDDLGPVLPTGLNNGNSLNIVEDINDPLGREYYIGTRIRF